MLRAVLFDLVGTLLDFGDGRLLKVGMRISSVRAIYRNLKAQGLPLPSPLHFAWVAYHHNREIDRTAGADGYEKNLRVSIPRVLQTMHVPLDRFDIQSCLDALYEGTKSYVSLFDDTLEVLDWLQQRGLVMGLVSNTVWPSALHERDIADFGLDRYLQVRTFSSEHGQSKPAARIYLDTLARLGVAPTEAVFVGDRMRQDVWGPQQVGMRAVLIESPYRRERMPGVQPDARIRLLRELLPWVERWMS